MNQRFCHGGGLHARGFLSRSSLGLCLGALLSLGVVGTAKAQASRVPRKASQRSWQRHIVRSGETLGAIADRYRVFVKHLVEWNQLENPDQIQVGMTLRVFAPASPATQGANLSRDSAQRPAPVQSTSHQSGSSPVRKPRRPERASRRREHFGKGPGPAARELPDLATTSAEKPTKAPASASSMRPSQVQLGPVDRARLHTIPTRRSIQQKAPLVFALADLRGPLEAQAPKSWWQRRKERRRARRARRWEAKRQRALADQRAYTGSSTYSPKSGRDRFNRSRTPLARYTPNPAPVGRAQSVGLPNKGKLKRGVQLESTNWYTVRTPAESWGSSHTINELHHAVVRFRKNSRYRRELVIQDISLRSGGRFPPHRSHQSGRDVDIRLCVNHRVAKNGVPKTVNQVDWDATWALIHELIKSGQVEYIFLNYDRQRHLYRAAKRAGVPKAQLARWIQYPTHSKSKRSGVVRHSKGHAVHMHVRFRCGRDERRCRTR